MTDGAAATDGPGTFGSCAAGLAAALDAMLALDGDALGDSELAEAMVALRRQQSRLAASVAELTAVFEARKVHAEDGSRSATDWIAVHCGLPRPRVAGEVRDARRLRSMPATSSALRAGEISAAHAGVLCRLAGHPRAGQHFAAGEDHLVDQARRLRFDDWKLVCDHWLAAADPDGPERRRERDHQLRRFGIPLGLHGVGHPDGYLTPLAAATVTGALEAIEHELFTADWAAAREIHGDATTGAHLARTAGQRRHDALVEMATRAMTAPADGRRPAPLVTVMVDFATLAGRVCELAGTGTVIAPGDIVELLGRDDTLMQRVVFTGANRVRDISTARSFRGVLRRILDATHRRCEHRTCFVPAHRCQGDHIVPWSHGGTTSQDNGGLGCGFHNRWWYSHPEQRRPPAVLVDATPDPAGADPDEQPHDGRWLFAVPGELDIIRHGPRTTGLTRRASLVDNHRWQHICVA